MRDDSTRNVSSKPATREYATGRWPELLRLLDVPDEILSGKHVPCPGCGGKDRFRFDNKEGRGTYFCAGCGPGDGFRLLELVFGWSFQQAALRIDRLAGTTPITPRIVPPAQQDYERLRKILINTWSQCTSQFEVTEYLCGTRGLNPATVALISPINVAGTKSLSYFEDGKVAGHYPAMVAKIRDVNGYPISLHRTYLLDGRREKKIMTPLKSIVGASIRLISNGSDSLLIGEGIETALAAYDALIGRDRDAWAAISAHGMEMLEVPDKYRRITIIADNDQGYAGQAAAFTLARRLARDKKRDVRVVMPSIANDFDDLMRGQASVPPIGGYYEWDNQNPL